jgi:branched-chain amino acid transport system substrate-binding protein
VTGRKLYVGAAVACALAVVSMASAAGTATPGVTSNSVLIGGTMPLTGPASAYASVAKGADAYFKYKNDQGGVDGRKVKYKYYDDAYDPSKTVEKTRQLVQQDHVFAVFNTLGTQTNIAIRSYLNQLKVPHLFIAAGATTFGRDYKKYPWTLGYQLSYIAEASIYGRYILKTKPKARVGVLYQNDDYGKDLLAGLKRGLGSKSRLIIATQSYNVTDADVKAQISKLKAAKANVFMIFATPSFAIQSYSYVHKLGWHPQVFVNAASSAANIMKLATLASSKGTVEGSISAVFLKDPTDPKWSKDPGIKLYRQILKKYSAGSNPNDFYNVYGMAVAFTMVDTLKRVGKNLTRPAVMKAATHLTEHNNPFILPGIVVHTMPGKRFPIAQAKLERYRNGIWASFGGLLNTR